MSVRDNYVEDVKASWAYIDQQIEAGMVPVVSVRKELVEYIFTVGVVLAANEVRVLMNAGHREIVDKFRTTGGRKELVDVLCDRLQKSANDNPELRPPLSVRIDRDLFFGFTTGALFGLTSVLALIDGSVRRKSKKRLSEYVDEVRQYSESLAEAAGYI